MSVTVFEVYNALVGKAPGTQFQLRFENTEYGSRVAGWVWLEVEQGHLTVDASTHAWLHQCATARNIVQTPNLRQFIRVTIAEGFNVAEFAYHMTEGFMNGLRKIELVS